MPLRLTDTSFFALHTSESMNLVLRVDKGGAVNLATSHLWIMLPITIGGNTSPWPSHGSRIVGGPSSSGVELSQYARQSQINLSWSLG
ncbi:hypothetical protein NDU88_006669 [Pleurodeles waltl]|uniref:Uncharacterized protein n=1 Tax=Pleurodeles waltl TaxID=8319 RepID=A0AAV7WB77_PLEWA|nr:hypothetical protein NDU88_006669 [Pleurodeles waltl]